MLCSKCSRPVVPVVAIDIDGTLGDYHGHFDRFAAAYLGMGDGLPLLHTYDGGEPHSDWFCRTFEVDKRMFRDIKLAYRQGAMKRSMPIYPGATELVQGLYEDIEVWLTTTRPYLRLDNIDPDTRAWLERHDIPYDGLLYHEDKYRHLAEAVEEERVVAVLDDLPEMYDAAATTFGEHVPILRMNDYNRRAAWSEPRTHYCAVVDLQEAAEHISHRVEVWRERHG